jgi:hypothetical protein
MGTGFFLGVESSWGVTLTPKSFVACKKGETYLYYNLMGPLSYMWSFIDRNVVMQFMTVCTKHLISEHCNFKAEVKENYEDV